jgi:hypothetical protein
MFFRLFAQLIRRADSRAACTAGSNSATRMPIMAITTSNSTSVNPRRVGPEMVGEFVTMYLNGWWFSQKPPGRAVYRHYFYDTHVQESRDAFSRTFFPVLRIFAARWGSA